MRDRKPYQRYSPDFRHDAVQLVMSSDETLRAVADRLGVNYWTLRGWYREAMRKKRTSKRVSESQPRENETAEERLARVTRRHRARAPNSCLPPPSNAPSPRRPPTPVLLAGRRRPWRLPQGRGRACTGACVMATGEAWRASWTVCGPLAMAVGTARGVGWA